MTTETKQHRAGRASRFVATAAAVALGVGALAAPAMAIEDDGRMVEENALLLHGQFAGFGEHGFYVDPSAMKGMFIAPWILIHKALIAPVAMLGNVGSIFPREGYRAQ